jgi:hypothetical protein
VVMIAFAPRNFLIEQLYFDTGFVGVSARQSPIAGWNNGTCVRAWAFLPDH